MTDDSAAKKILSLLEKYDPNVARTIQNPVRRAEIEKRLQGSIDAMKYGFAHDAGDAAWEFAEDLIDQGGLNFPVEVASLIAEYVVIGPLARRYAKSLEKYHPVLSKSLTVYQAVSELPVLDSILSKIPEKGLFAVYAFISDIYNIKKEAKEYVRSGDYVKELYGKDLDKGVPGIPDENYGPHPLRPVYGEYATT